MEYVTMTTVIDLCVLTSPFLLFSFVIVLSSSFPLRLYLSPRVFVFSARKRRRVSIE